MGNASISNQLIWPNYANPVAKTSSGQTLGKDDFLHILVTQLRYQDPLQPMEDREFIAQMAQFSSLEQLMNVADEMRHLRESIGMATGLIGKEITWELTMEDGSTIELSGVVDSIMFKDGKQWAVVGNQEISIDRVTRVANPESAE